MWKPGAALVLGSVLGAILGTVATDWARIGNFPDGTSLLWGTTPGALIGLLIGVTVWIARPKRDTSTPKLLVTRGLIGAAVCIVAVASIAGVAGGLHGVSLGHVGGGPGGESALLAALITVMLGGVPAAVCGFVIGALVARVVRQTHIT